MANLYVSELAAALELLCVSITDGIEWGNEDIEVSLPAGFVEFVGVLAEKFVRNPDEKEFILKVVGQGADSVADQEIDE